MPGYSYYSGIDTQYTPSEPEKPKQTSYYRPSPITAIEQRKRQMAAQARAEAQRQAAIREQQRQAYLQQQQEMMKYYNQQDKMARQRAEQQQKAAQQQEKQVRNDNYGQAGQYYGENFGYQNNIDLSSGKPAPEGYGGYYTSYGFQPAPRELPGQTYFTSYGQQNKVGVPNMQGREGEAPIDFRNDGWYGPVKPIAPRANAFGASSVYAAPYEGENGRWAASNGLEYRQINAHYGMPQQEDQQYPYYGGYGGYPSYSYPSYDYPEPAKSWYENMLQWNI